MLIFLSCKKDFTCQFTKENLRYETNSLNIFYKVCVVEFVFCSVTEEITLELAKSY